MVLVWTKHLYYFDFNFTFNLHWFEMKKHYEPFPVTSFVSWYLNVPAGFIWAEIISMFSVSKVTEVATGGVLLEKVLLEILQNSQENICATVLFF